MTKTYVIITNGSKLREYCVHKYTISDTDQPVGSFSSFDEYEEWVIAGLYNANTRYGQSCIVLTEEEYKNLPAFNSLR